MKYLYPGAFHIHTTYSDGSGTIEEIVKAAKKAGLAWIIITDHNKMEVNEGIYDGIYVIVGEEISPPENNHYIAININKNISHEMPPFEWIEDVKSQGGFGFIAHPDESSTRKNSYTPIKWQDWTIKDFGGIEIWNYMSNWADSYDENNILKSIYSFLFRNKVLTGPTAKTLTWWDNLNNESDAIIPAVCGLDVHAFKVKKFLIPLKIFPYKNSFYSLTNFIHCAEPLNNNFEESKKIIINALTYGHNTIVNRAHSTLYKKDFKSEFYIETSGKRAHSGEIIEIDGTANIVLELPQTMLIRIKHDGKCICEETTKAIRLNSIPEGKYRFEAYYKNHPLIFSNPIILKQSV